MQKPILQLCRKLLLVACSSFIIQTATAQANYTITPFTPRDGLVSADIISLFQDSKNYLWVGHAAGVSRYDGYQFENFLYTAEQRVGKTYCIAEDDQHNIWIGAENGLFLYRQGRLRTVSTGKQQRPVYALLFDNNNRLWIGSSEGPSFFSKNEWQQVFTNYELSLHEHLLPAWQQFFKGAREVTHMSAGNDGSLYFGDGYAIHKFFNGGLSPAWKAAGSHDPLKSIIAFNKDSVFICSSYGGLQAVENGVYRRTPAKKLGTSNALIKRNGSFYYYCLVGIYEVDPQTLDVRELFPFSSTQWEWGSVLLQDNESNFWVGTHEQLCYARRNFFTGIQQPGLMGFDELYSVKRLSDGSLVCGGNRGKLFRRSSDTSAFDQWQHLFPLAAVTDIHEEPGGATWFGSSYQGITLLQNNTLRRFTVNEGLRDNTNFMLFKSRRGELFAGGDRGVSQILKDEEGTVHFKNYHYHTGSTDYAIVYCGLDKPSGGLLFGSNRGLLEIKDSILVPGHIKNSSRRNYNITDMRSDAQGNVWISTVGDGILICSFENDSLKLEQQLTEQDGLSSLIWLQLLIDADNITWAAGYNGITRIERTGNRQYFIAEYGRMHGFIPQLFHTIKMMQDKDGLIWIPTSSGLMKFDPAAPGRSVHPSLQLTRMRITDEGSGKETDSLFTASTPTKALRLPFQSNSISFAYTGIYLSHPSSVIYAYRLIGQDTNWVYAADNRNVSFRHLQPGSYRFEVKAAAGTNQWSTITAFPFVIEPPFWQRWWFLLLCALLGASLMLAIIKIYIDHIRRREAEKTRVQQLISENLQYRLEIEKVISYFAASIAGKQTMDEILWDVARNCIARLGFEDCVIYLLDEERHVLLQKAAWGPKTSHQNTILNPIEIPVGEGIVGAVAQTGKAEIVNDTAVDPRYIIDDKQRRSEIAVPIIEEGKVIGVIDSEHSDRNFYTERHLHILITIASLCADKLVLMKTASERQQAQLEALQNKQKATEARLQSMRLQMNPHFLFNALNSIQQMILAGDETVATRCLSKFSKLLRLILIHSDREKVTLREELETLRLYVDLESFRFKDRFEYFVTCDNSIDQDETRIPTLLIQPFVENAIWHGLMHKEGSRRLQVHFTEEKDTLVCIIEDNGIGRQASKAIKENSMHEHKHTGKGIAVASERLKIFSEHSGDGSHLEIIDLKDHQGTAAGTRVVVKLPV